MRVLLVDDSDVFRSTLELLLGAEEDIEVAGTAADGSEALSACAASRVDVVLLDFRLPGADGVSVTAALRECHPELAVVCLTAAATPDEREAVRAAGAAAVVEKGDLPALLATIREVAPPGDSHRSFP